MFSSVILYGDRWKLCRVVGRRYPHRHSRSPSKPISWGSSRCPRPIATRQASRSRKIAWWVSRNPWHNARNERSHQKFFSPWSKHHDWCGIGYFSRVVFIWFLWLLKWSIYDFKLNETSRWSLFTLAVPSSNTVIDARESQSAYA